MSYAGKATRDRTRSTPLPGRQNPPSGTGSMAPPRLRPAPEIDWQEVAIFATGIAVGLVAGAGAALLFAPASGRKTRRSIARAARKLPRRTRDAWDDLRDELRRAGRRGKRRMRDALDDRRHRREREAMRAALSDDD